MSIRGWKEGEIQRQNYAKWVETGFQLRTRYATSCSVRSYDGAAPPRGGPRPLVYSPPGVFQESGLVNWGCRGFPVGAVQCFRAASHPARGALPAERRGEPTLPPREFRHFWLDVWATPCCVDQDNLVRSRRFRLRPPQVLCRRRPEGSVISPLASTARAVGPTGPA